ncbi:pPE family protein [Mycobacterium ulcerans str. Harvey]|uniref:PPE family protein n=1 Tax=Mycobacterium ulcerans str. Harvey TaxID=1299332 RepID=A0ABP3ALH7_MYCUL|nr:pPE family protein [Mycobacterium ulcerans str. Harvey]
MNTGVGATTDSGLATSGFGNTGEVGISGFGNTATDGFRSGDMSGFFNTAAGGSSYTGVSSGFFNTGLTDPIGPLPAVCSAASTRAFSIPASPCRVYSASVSWRDDRIGPGAGLRPHALHREQIFELGGV